MPGTWVIDATDHDFELAVVQRSMQVPVVVDFWAPWCGPCRTLGPLLERLAEEHAGAFVLAKVNVDENPGLAEAFAVQSIPMVVALRGGKVAQEFVGALPESGVREFLARILPSEGDRLTVEGEELLAAGETAGAEARFHAALELDPRHGGALVGMASVFAAEGADDAALDVLQRVDPGPQRARADKLAAEIRVRQSGGAGANIESLRLKAEADPSDLEAHFALAQSYAANGQHEDALRTYLEIVGRDRGFRDDGARKAMIDIFAVLGGDNPLTDRFRSELGKVLFR